MMEYKYEIAKVVNDDIVDRLYTNNIEFAIEVYNFLIEHIDNNEERIIIYIFDFDKSIKIYEYDSEFDRC